MPSLLSPIDATPLASVDVGEQARTLEDYARLLGDLLSWHRDVAAQLTEVRTAAPRSLIDRLGGRIARAEADLASLGRREAPSRFRRRAPALELPTIAHQLGAWSVLEASALEGRRIADQLRETLPGAASALSFLAGDGSSAAYQWRAFQRFADRLEREAHLGAHEIHSGARCTSAHFVAIMGPDASD